MIRVFSLLAAITLLLALMIGLGVQWLSQHAVTQARATAAQVTAQSLATTLSGQLDLLDRTLLSMAQDPEVIEALVDKDPKALAAQAANLEKHFPEALKVRLLLPTVNELDKDSEPRMGFADLDMVKETLKKDQYPSIQGDDGPDRHLAMTQQVLHKDQVAGVILASLRYSFIHKLLKEAKPDGVYLQLRQDKLMLAEAGDPRLKGGDNLQHVAVPGSDWVLDYWYDSGADLGQVSLLISMILIPLSLIGLSFFSLYRILTRELSQDLSTIIKAFKDLMANKPQTNYPINLPELNAIIPTLMQFKRVIATTELVVTEPEEFELNGFFSDTLKESTLEKVIDPPPKSIASPVAEPVAVTVAPAPVKDDPFDSLFKAYDIRGIVGKALTEDVIRDIGKGLGTLAAKNGCKTLVIGRDGRVSSPALATALAEGIITTGCDVMDIGMIPTPMLYFVAQHIEGRSGIMITGSHNPADYNGLKMVLNGETLAGEKIQELKKLVKNRSFTQAEPGTIQQNTDYIDEYIGMISEDISVSRPLKIVLDAGNGVTGEIGPVLLKNLNCEIIELFCEIDGTFPNHHPDPSKPENLQDLISAVKFYDADVGIAFDGDGDRLGVVDNLGNIIWPDRQMMLFAKDVLANKPGSEIIYDVKCSRHLGAQIAKFGGRGTMWKTGHSLMKAKLKETGAKLAGEMSGHIFFNDRWFGFDDALYSAARLLEILARDSRSSSEIFAEFPDSVNTPELNIPMQEGENFSFMESLTSQANFGTAKITDIDGLRVDFPNGWGLVRASNTTPSLVVRFEADTPEILADIQQQFKALMKKIKPDIELPF